MNSYWVHNQVFKKKKFKHCVPVKAVFCFQMSSFVSWRWRSCLLPCSSVCWWGSCGGFRSCAAVRGHEGVHAGFLCWPVHGGKVPHVQGLCIYLFIFPFMGRRCEICNLLASCASAQPGDRDDPRPEQPVLPSDWHGEEPRLTPGASRIIPGTEHASVTHGDRMCQWVYVFNVYSRSAQSHCLLWSSYRTDKCLSVFQNGCSRPSSAEVFRPVRSTITITRRRTRTTAALWGPLHPIKPSCTHAESHWVTTHSLSCRPSLTTIRRTTLWRYTHTWCIHSHV